MTRRKVKPGPAKAGTVRREKQTKRLDKLEREKLIRRAPNFLDDAAFGRAVIRILKSLPLNEFGHLMEGSGKAQSVLFSITNAAESMGILHQVVPEERSRKAMFSRQLIATLQKRAEETPDSVRQSGDKSE